MIGQLGSYSKYSSKESFGATASHSAPPVVQKKQEQKDEVKLSQSKSQISQQPQRNFWDRNLSAILGITSLSFMAIMGLNFIMAVAGRRAAAAASKVKTESLLRKFVPDASSPKGFQDVIGMHDVKEKLKMHYIEPLKSPEVRRMYKEDYLLKDSGLPSGTLLIGDPGNGKTHIVKALAAELKTDLYMLNMSDVGEIYIHGTGKNLAQALDDIKLKAKKSDKPVILFMDELDSIPRRSGGDAKSHEIEELNTILQNINDLQKHNIILIGATNRADLIDDAILREGRFGKHIEVGNPSAAARKEFLERRLGDMPKGKDFMANGQSVGYIVEQLAGMSNSNINGLIDEVCKVAGRENGSNITKEHFMSVIENTPKKQAERAMGRQIDEAQKFLAEFSKEMKKAFGFLNPNNSKNLQSAGGISGESDLDKIVREADAKASKKEAAVRVQRKKIKAKTDAIQAARTAEHEEFKAAKPMVLPTTPEEFKVFAENIKADTTLSDVQKQMIIMDALESSRQKKS